MARICGFYHSNLFTGKNKIKFKKINLSETGIRLEKSDSNINKNFFIFLITQRRVKIVNINIIAKDTEKIFCSRKYLVQETGQTKDGVLDLNFPFLDNRIRGTTSRTKISKPLTVLSLF